MRNILALARREVNAAFLSPLAYVVLTIFLVYCGFFFYFTVNPPDRPGEASLAGTVVMISFFFLVAMPLLTMRLLSEEYRSGTIEMLLTAPVTDGQVILGKFLGALAFYLFMLLPTGIYVVLLLKLGAPDLRVILASYIGLLAMGCAFIALGLFCSALTANQIVAGVLALVGLLLLFIIGSVGEHLTGALKSVLSYLGAGEHVQHFATGRVAFRDLFYFFSMTCFWLFLSVRALESKRWR